MLETVLDSVKCKQYMSKYPMYQRKNDSKIWKYVDLMYDKNITLKLGV